MLHNITVPNQDSENGQVSSCKLPNTLLRHKSVTQYFCSQFRDTLMNRKEAELHNKWCQIFIEIILQFDEIMNCKNWLALLQGFRINQSIRACNLGNLCLLRVSGTMNYTTQHSMHPTTQSGVKYSRNLSNSIRRMC